MRLLILLFALMTSLNIMAQAETLFNRATEAYNEGEYNKAIDYYQRILDSGKHSAELYFNMGNAHYKLENIGPSIYYYEKALLLKPNDAEIENNLSYAQNMRLDAIEELPQTALSKAYGSIVNFLGYNQWAKLAILGMIIFVLGYSAYYLFSRALTKRLLFIGAFFFLGITIVSFAMAYFSYQEYSKQNPGIIFSREVVVSSEPNERSERVFTLHEGTKVNVEEELNDWAKIRIADGQTGWMPSEDLKLLKNF